MDKLLEFGSDQVWTSFIISAITLVALFSFFSWIKKVFLYFYKKHERETELFKKIEKIEINNKMMEAITDVLFIQMRHSIVRICEESLKAKIIGANELESLEELFAKYGGEPFNGNSYVHNLMEKTRRLPIDYSNGDPKEIIVEQHRQNTHVYSGNEYAYSSEKSFE